MTGGLFDPRRACAPVEPACPAELVPRSRPDGLPHDAFHGWCLFCGKPTRSIWLKACSTRECVAVVMRMNALGRGLNALAMSIARVALPIADGGRDAR